MLIPTPTPVTGQHFNRPMSPTQSKGVSGRMWGRFWTQLGSDLGKPWDVARVVTYVLY